MPWYCHGCGTDCGQCSDVSYLYCHGTAMGMVWTSDMCFGVSYSYCHGTDMVMVVTDVCGLMFLPHIAMVVAWLRN